MKTTPDPVECVCGADAYVAEIGRMVVEGRIVPWYYVRCGNNQCWQGPQKPTADDAVWQWDDLMLSECV